MTLADRRILLATFGSLGDLHPMIALGRGLAARGAQVTLATSALHGPRVEAAGLRFAPVRPDVTPDDAALTRRVLHHWRGPEVLVRELTMRPLRETVADLTHAARDAQLLIYGEVVYAAPLVAERLGLPRVPAILSPLPLLSAHDPPVYPGAPAAAWLHRAPLGIQRSIQRLARWRTRPWFREVDALREELGLGAARHPLFEDKFSSLLNLVLFSRELAQPQPDWPQHTVQAGFLWYDGDAGLEASRLRELEEFLAAGEPPLVFTLGSSAVFDPGSFYEQGLLAARRLGRRALFLAGANPLQVDRAELASRRVAVFDYLPHSRLFPHAACIVHQGGVGTTAQAMRAGRPQLVVPFAFDQPDNAARIKRLGLGRSLARRRFEARRAARLIEAMLGDAAMSSQCEQCAGRLRAERSLERACDAIESLRVSAATS